MKLAVFAALLAIALPAPAFAADWVLVGQGAASNAKSYIDRQSIRTTPNGYKRAWMKTIHAQPTNLGVSVSRILKECDCSGGRFRYLQQTYLRDEEIITTVNTTSEWYFVEPEAVDEATLNFVCYGKR